MSPILERGVYHADCLAFLERIPDGSATLAYLDPPTAESMTATHSLDAYKALMDKTIRQLHRVLADDGSVYCQSTVRNANYLRVYFNKYFGEEAHLDEYPLRNIEGRREHVIIYARGERTRQRVVFTQIENAHVRDFRKDKTGSLYRLEVLTRPIDRPDFRFRFKGYKPPHGSWRYSKENLQAFDEQGLIELTPNGIPRLRRYTTPDNKIEVTSDWSDVPDEVPSDSDEYVDFETQRPQELLRRIITTATDPGDLVIDPFCGSGTSFVAAQKVNRIWIGCDVEETAYHTAISRLQQEFGFLPQRDYQTGGTELLKARFPVIATSAYRRYFISYSRRDTAEFVDPFCAELDAAGIDYWIDRFNIPNGAEWRVELERALTECDGMILFRTPDALDSEYVDYEWRAFAALEKPIYQIACRRTHAPRELNRFQYTEFVDRLIFIRQLRSLALEGRGR